MKYQYLLWIVLIAACGSTKYLSNKSLKPYDASFSAQYRIFHQADKSYIALKANSKSYRLILNAHPSYRSKTKLYNNSIQVDDAHGKIRRYNLPSDTARYVLEIIVTNLSNGAIYRDVVGVEKTKNSPQSILVEQVNGVPLLGNYVGQKKQLKFKHNKPEINYLYVKYFDEIYKAASPPSSTRTLRFNAERKPTKVFRVHRDSLFSLTKMGLYFVQQDTAATTGAFVNCFQEDFPKLTKAEDLILSIRYITKNSEYQALETATDKKQALDKFWLKRASSRGRAKRLIGAYYSRIQFANQYFTTYKEGWKTDRGIIYTIFGPPENVKKNPNYEYWYYEATRRRPAVNFYFEQEEQQFILRRSPILERSWRAEIFEWRKGVI